MVRLYPGELAVLARYGFSLMTPRLRIVLLASLLIALSAAPGAALSAPGAVVNTSAAASKDNDPSSDEAALEFWNRKITVLRFKLAGSDPKDRVSRAIERLNELPITARSSDIVLVPIKVEDQDGIGLTYQGRILFFIAAADVDKEAGDTLANTSQRALAALDEALQAREAERQWPVIRRGVLYSLLGFVLLFAFVWLVWRAYRIVYGFLRGKEHSFPAKLRLFGIDLLPHIAGLIYALLRALAWLFTLSAVYSWLSFSLGRFPYTQPWGQQMGGYVLHFLQGLGISAINTLPGIFACVVIFIITRWVVRLAKAFFQQVANSSIRLSWMDADVARATERIFAFVAWVFAVVVAYPYIPGSSTDAFKGISVFFGLVISLGSTGIINQVMSGLFVVYSKALKTGDWVLVNETEGEVLEVGLLAAKVRTAEQQEVTIPNSVLVATSTKNFTRLGYPNGMAITCTVTIGYDAPWRQVHALLLLGAERTGNVRRHPAPYVLQRALSDFYVEYTLIARIQDEKLRIETLSELHGNIQDAFNEYGVQILSPHFVLQPQGAVVVPRSKWHSAPAAPENGDSAQVLGESRHFEAGK